MQSMHVVDNMQMCIVKSFLCKHGLDTPRRLECCCSRCVEVNAFLMISWRTRLCTRMLYMHVAYLESSLLRRVVAATKNTFRESAKCFMVLDWSGMKLDMQSMPHVQ